jgi:hypothetical protein
MKKKKLENGDIQVAYKTDVEGKLIDKPLVCVMCGKLAFFIAKETKEPLCERCFRNNIEARGKK